MYTYTVYHAPFQQQSAITRLTLQSLNYTPALIHTLGPSRSHYAARLCPSLHRALARLDAAHHVCQMLSTNPHPRPSHPRLAASTESTAATAPAPAAFVFGASEIFLSQAHARYEVRLAQLCQVQRGQCAGAALIQCLRELQCLLMLAEPKLNVRPLPRHTAPIAAAVFV